MEIQALSSMEDIVKEEHYVKQAFNKLLYEFNDGDQGQSIIVEFVWGTNGINKTGVDHFNASDIGKPIWDDNFDISHPKSQKAIDDFCQGMKTMDSLLYSKSGSVSCWVDDFKVYVT